MRRSTCMFFYLLAFASAALAFDPRFHSEVTKAALRSSEVTVTISGEEFKFTEQAREQINEAQLKQDKGWNPNVPVNPFANSRLHFDGETIDLASDDLTRRKATIVRLLTTALPVAGAVCDGERARIVLGQALHAIEDYYAHSNWLESTTIGQLGLPDRRLGREKITRDMYAGSTEPTCSPDAATILPGSKLTTGYFFGATGKDDDRLPQGKCYHGSVTHGGINKDNPETGVVAHRDAKDLAQLAAIDFVKQIFEELRTKTNFKEAVSALMGVEGTLAIVVDDTGSMGGEIAQIKLEVGKILDNVVGTDKEPGLYVLVRYGDPDVGAAFRTTDPNVFRAKVNELVPRGGGDCPELAMQALLNAIGGSCQDSNIYFFSDASAKDAVKAPNVVARARVKRIVITHILTGSCSPIAPEYVRIAEDTGGQLFFLNRSEVSKTFDLVEPQLSGDFVSILQASGTLSGAPRQFTVPVDSSISNIVFSLSVDNPGATVLVRPSGTTVSASDPGVTMTSLSSGQIISVEAPETGQWNLTITGTGSFSVAAKANSSLQFYRFDFVERVLGPHPGFFSIPGEPVVGQDALGRATLIGPFDTAEFNLVTRSGVLIGPAPLALGDEHAGSEEFVGEIPLPSGPFRISVSGQDTSGASYTRLFPPSFRAQPLEVSIDTEPFVESLPIGKTTTVGFLVQNFGSIDLQTRIVVADDQQFITSFSPSTALIGVGDTVRVEASVTVPAGTEEGVLVSVAATATSTANPEVFNSAGVTLPTEGGVVEVPVDIKPGSDPNSINPRSKGEIPVVILTTDDFDALDVDSSTLAFGPARAGIAHSMGHAEDVDGDGDIDLVVHFNTQETGIACGDTEATLTGETVDGTAIEGADSVKTAGCK